MTEKKKSLLGIVLVFAAFLVVCGIIYLVSLIPVTASDIGQFVSISAAVKQSEIQDESGKFILLDYPDVDLSQYVVLGDYRNMTIDEVPTYEVSEEDIQENLASYIGYYQRYDHVTEGTVVTGDPITVSYTGYLDGEVMSEYVAEERRMQLGYAGEPAGFTNALHGATIGEPLEFDVTMPDDWTDSAVAGKQMHFQVTIHDKLVIPELNDDTVGFITDGKYQTADEFVEFLKSQIATYYDQVKQATISDEVLAKLDEICQYNTPPHELMTWCVSILMKYYQDYADENGMTVEEAFKSAGFDVSMDDVMFTMGEAAVSQLPTQVTLTAIAKNAGITLDLEEDAELIQARKQYVMENFGYETEADMLANYKESNILHDALNQKTLLWLCANVKQVPKVEESGEADVTTESTGDAMSENLAETDEPVVVDGESDANIVEEGLEK